MIIPQNQKEICRMSHPLNSILKVSVAAASLALLAGCATQAQDTSAMETGR